MDQLPKQSNVNCSYCEKSVPAANIDLHSAHCFRMMKRSKHGNEMMPGAEESKRNVNGADSGDGASNESSRKGLMSTVAVASVIVLIGSIFFRREGHNQHLR